MKNHPTVDKFIEARIKNGEPQKEAEKKELQFYNCYQQWESMDKESKIEYKVKNDLGTLYDAYQHFIKRCKNGEI